MICAGCQRPIPEGMHFMKVCVELHTAGEERWAPLANFTTMEVIVHHPICFTLWAGDNDILIDVFADIGKH